MSPRRSPTLPSLPNAADEQGGEDMVTSMWSTWQRELRRELAIEPTERQPLGALRMRVAYAAAIFLPLAVGALMIPLRDELDQSTALILVVPVLLVALAGGIGPGLLARFREVLVERYGRPP